MSDIDPAAEPDLREKILKAAGRGAVSSRSDKSVIGGDKARIIKEIRGRWEIHGGDYCKDAPTSDELVNLCATTATIRGGHWMLYMSKGRFALDLADLIRRPLTGSGLPVRQVQILENELTGAAQDIYRGIGVGPQYVGLVVRLGTKRSGLFVYGMHTIVPDSCCHASFHVGDPQEDQLWRAIFPLEGLLAHPQGGE